MINDFKASNEIALTVDEYHAVMESRTRPLGDPYMDNWRASKARSEAAMTYGSAMDIGVDLAQQVADARRARIAIPDVRLPAVCEDDILELRSTGGRQRAQCGTSAGYTAHLRAKEVACTSCLAANRAKRAKERASRREMTRPEISAAIDKMKAGAA